MGIKKRWVAIVGFSILVAGAGLCAAQTQGRTRATRYFKLLCQRPSGDYLFDRFYDAWLDDGTVEDLEGFLKQAEEQQPDANHKLLLSFFYERQGNHGEVLVWLDRALEQAADRPDILLLRAQAAVRLRQFDRAIEDLLALEGMELESKERIEAGQMLARLYVRVLKPDLARETWQRLLQAFPEDEDLYEELIELQWDEGLYDDALATSEALLERTDDPYLKVMRHLRKGDIQQVKGMKDEALATYSGCLDWVGQGTWLENQICSQIAEVFRREDDMAGLLEVWKSLCETYPQRLGLKERYAQRLLQSGEYEQALDLYRSMVRSAPGDMQVQQALIGALVQTDEVDRAIELLGQLQERYPQDLELLIQMARLQARQERLVEAGETLNRYLERCDRSESNYIRVARLLERYQRLGQAFVVYTSLLQEYPESLTALEAYADCLYRNDKPDMALERWQRIAQAGDLTMLLKMVQTANLHGFSEQALTWLRDQYDAYHTEPGFLDSLNQQALRCEAYEQASAWMLEQLNQAERFTQVQGACRHILTLVRQTQSLAHWVERLQGRQRSIPETCLLAQLLAMQNRMDEAHQVAEAVQSQNPELILQQKISLYQQQYRWEAAADCTRELMEILGTQEIYALRQIVELYQKAGLVEEALKWIPVWKRLAPNNVEVWRTEAVLLKNLGRYGEAVSTLRRANAVLDGDKSVLTQLAQMYREMGRWNEACRVTWHLYEESRDISDKLQWVRQLAQDMIRQNQGETLIEQFEQRRRNNRSSVVPCLALAEIYRQLGQYEQRRQALMEATRLRPQDLSLLHEIAQIEETEGDWEQALETLKQAAALDSTSKTRQRMAMLHIQYGNEQEGYRLLFDQAEQQIPDPRELEKMVLLMTQNEDWGLVVEFLRPHLQQFPKDYRLHWLYAVALEQEGRDTEALGQFLRVMDMDEELPSQQVSVVQQVQESLYRQFIPQSLHDFIEVINTCSRVYQVRSSRYYNRYYWNGMAASQQVVLPERVRQVPSFCLAHLITLAYRGTAEDQQQFLTQVQYHGYQEADVMLALGQWQGQQIHEHILELQEQFPQNKTVMGLALMYQGGNGVKELKPEVVRQACDAYRPTHPIFSMTMALAYGAVYPDANDLLRDAMTQLQAQDQVDYYLMSRVASVLIQEDTRLTEQQQEVLRQQFRTWCDKIPEQHSHRFQMVRLWLNSLAQDKDLEALVEALDREFEQDRQSMSSVQSRYHYYGRSGYGDELIAPLECPPLRLMQSPRLELVIQLFPLNRDSAGAYAYYPGRSSRFTTDQVKQAVQLAQHPFLRAVLAIVAEDYPTALEVLTAFTQEYPDESEARLLLASVLGKQGQEVEAMTQLVGVMTTSWGQSHRDQCLGALVAYGLDVDPEAQPEAAQWAREAAADLAYRSGGTNRQQETILRVLDQLGMEKELQEIVQRRMVQQRMAQQSQQRGLYSGGMTGGRGNTLARVEELLQKERPDAALRVALRTLKASGSSSGRVSRDEVQSLITLIQSYHMEDRLLQMSHPGESDNPRRWLFHGRLCQSLGRQEQAGQIYTEILQQRPRHVETRMQMIDYLLEKGDPNEVLTSLVNLEFREQAAAGEMLGYMSDNRGRESQAELEQMISVAHIAQGYLQQLRDPNGVGLDWIARIVNNLAENRYYSNEVHLAALYRERREDLPEEFAALDQQRFELHQSLSRAMVAIPSLASRGFIQFYNAARINDPNEDAWMELAWQAWRMTQLNRNYSSSRSTWGVGREHRSLTAVEVLLHESWRRDEFSLCVQQLLETCRAQDRETLSTQLQLLSDLYQAEGDDFTAAAEALESTWPQGRVQGMMAFDSPDLRRQYALEVYAERDLDCDMDALMTEWCRQGEGYSGTNQRGQLYLTTIAKHRSPDQVAAWLESVLTVYLGGDREQWPQLLTQQSLSSGRDNAQVRQAYELLRQALEDRSLFWPTMQVVKSLGRVDNRLNQGIRNTLNNVVQDLRRAQEQTSQASHARGGRRSRISMSASAEEEPVDPNVILEFLKAAPFMGDLADFDPIALEGIDQGTLMGYLVRQWSSWNQVFDVNSGIFGEAFIASLSDNDSQVVYRCLGRFWPEFQQLSEPQQRDLVVVINARRSRGGTVQLEDLSCEQERQVYQWLAAQQDDAYTEQLASFLAVKRIEDLPIESHQLKEYVRTLLWNVAPHDIDAGKAILLKAKALTERAQLLGSNRYYYGSGIITRVMAYSSRSGDFLPRLGLLTALVRDANGLDDLPDQQLISSATQNYHEFTNTLRRQFREDGLGQIKAAFTQMGPYVGSGDATPFMSVISESLPNARRDEDPWDDYVTFLQEQLAQGNYPGLARAFLIQIQWQKGRRNNRGGRSDDVTLPPEILNYFTDHFSDDSLPVAWRLMSLYGLTNRRTYSFNQPEFLVPLTQLIIQAMREYETVPSLYCRGWLGELLRMPHDETWTEQAGLLTQTYAEVMQRPLTTNGRRGSSMRTSDHILLEINLILGQEDRARQLILRPDSDLGCSPDCWVLLQRYHAHDLLAWVAQEYGETVADNLGRYLRSQSDDSMPDLQADLAAIEREDLRYFTEIVLTSRYAQMADESPETAEAMVTLAGRFSDMTFSSASLRMRALLFLSRDNQTLMHLSDELAQFAGEISPAMLVASSQDQLRLMQSELMAAYGLERILQGDPNYFITTVEGLGAYALDQSQNRHRAEQCIQRFQQGWENRLHRLLTAQGWTVTQIKAMADAGRALVLAQRSRGYISEQVLSRVLAYHILSEQEETFTSFYEELLENDTRGRISQLNEYQLFETLQNLVPRDKTPLEERVATLKRVLANEIARQILTQDRDRSEVLQRLRSRGLLSREEIDDHPQLMVELLGPDERIKTFLASNHFSELDGPEDVFLDVYVLELLAQPEAQDVNVAVALLTQAAAWAPEAKTVNRWQDGSDDDSLIYLLDRKEVRSLADIGILMTLVHGSDGGGVMIPDRYYSRLLDRLNQEVSQLRGTCDNSLLALQAFVEQLKVYTRGYDTTSLLGCLEPLGRQLDRGDEGLEACLAWLGEQIDQYPEESLYQDLFVVLSRRRTDLTEPMEERIYTRYKGVMTDPNLPLICRLQALKVYVITGKRAKEARWVYPVIDLFLDLWDEPLEWMTLYHTQSHIWNAFAQLDADEEWLERAESLSKALATKSRFKMRYYDRVVMFDIHLKAGWVDKAERIVTWYPSLADDLKVWSAFLRAERYDFVITLLGSSHLPLHKSSLEPFDREISEKLSELLTRIERADLRYYAEVLFNGLPDTRRGRSELELLSTQQDRLIALVQRYDQVEIPDDSLRSRILIALARSPELLPTLAPELTRVADALDCSALMQAPEESLQSLPWELWRTHARAQLMLGDPNVLIAGLEAFGQEYERVCRKYSGEGNIENPDRIRLSEMYEQIIGCSNTIVKHLRKQWSVDQMETQIKVLEASLQQPDVMKRLDSVYEYSGSLIWVCHLCAGHQAQDIEACVAQLPEKVVHELKQRLASRQYFSQVVNRLGNQIHNRDLPVEQRLSMVENLIHLEPVKELMQQSEDTDFLVDLFFRSAIFSREEIKEQGEALQTLLGCDVSQWTPPQRTRRGR